ncbi:MAG: hypothetical protein CEN90_675 [Parcubacteria group bacterium Licking1014_17]|nr:MAG: hypothetical protein CEN90_675 [Parcubacteria group bacterium Licking1014_17]
MDIKIFGLPMGEFSKMLIAEAIDKAPLCTEISPIPIRFVDSSTYVQGKGGGNNDSGRGRHDRR